MYKKLLAITFAIMFLSSVLSVTSGTMTPAFADKSNHHEIYFPKITSNVTVGAFPKSISVSEKFNKIYTVSPLDGNVTIIDGKTNKVVNSVFTATDPNYAVVDDQTNKIYVLSDGTSSIIILDSKTNKVIGSIPVANPHLPPGCNNITIPCTDQGSDSYSISINHKTGRLYVNNIADETVTVVDTKTNKVIDTIPVGASPYFSSVNEKTNKIYVVTGFDATVVVLDGKTDKVIKSIPIGSPATPNDCIYTFTCTSFGSFSIGITVNEETNKIYASNFLDATVVVIDGKTDQIIGSPIPTGSTAADFITVSEETNTVYVADRLADTLTIIDGKTDKIVGPSILVGTPAGPPGCDAFTCTSLGSWASGIAVNEETNRIYVVDQIDGTVVVLDAKTHHKIAEEHLEGHHDKDKKNDK